MDGNFWQMERKPFGIAMSGFTQRHRITKKATRRAKYHLTKPFLPDDLDALLEKAALQIASRSNPAHVSRPKATRRQIIRSPWTLNAIRKERESLCLAGRLPSLSLRLSQRFSGLEELRVRPRGLRKCSSFSLSSCFFCRSSSAVDLRGPKAIGQISLSWRSDENLEMNVGWERIFEISSGETLS